MNRFFCPVFFLWMISICSVGQAEKSCGEAKIISGSSCSTLKVRFNLEECGRSKNADALIECETDRASALVLDEEHTYHIPLREIAPGVWTLVGTIREYPKKWRPDIYGRLPIVFRSNRVQESSNNWPSIFEVSGQFRFRAEENRKNDFLSSRGFSSLRARAGLFFHPNEKVQFLIQPQACQLFGEPIFQAGTSNLNVSVGTSGVNRDPQLSFHQAYGEIRPFPIWRLILGRQTLSFGEEVLVGAADWENPGRSFDGVRSRLEWEKNAFDLFSTKLWDSNTQNSAKGDQEFHGAYFSWAQLNQNLTLQPYLFWLRDHRSSLKQLFTSGFHFKWHLDELDLNAEASGQWGNTSGQQIWAELKSKEFAFLGTRLGLDGFWSSPDFNPLFPSTHKWLGWADVLGRRNLAGLGFQIDLVSIGNSELKLRGLHFLKANTDLPAYQVDGTTPVNNASEKNQTLGSELDIALKNSIMPSVELMAAASIFWPSGSLKATVVDPWLGRFEVSLVSNF